MITGYHLTYPEILWHAAAMRMNHITSTATYTPAVPAFDFLFASAEKAPKKAKRGWLSRPALRSKRV